MGFARAVKTCLVKFGDFSGRAGPGEFWWFSLFQFLVIMTSAFAETVMKASTGGQAIITMSLAIALLLPIWAVSVRRLHDTDRSGWWLLLQIIPLGGLVLLFFFILPGTPSRNRFGPDPSASPRGGASAEAGFVMPDVNTEARASDLRALRQSRMSDQNA